MMLCHGSNYRKGRTGPISYIVIHYTAGDGDTAKGNCSYFHSNANRGASAHYFVDENGWEQSVEDCDTAWHCGAASYKHPSCRNGNSLGIELCSRKDIEGTYYFLPETVSNAVELTRQLMERYQIPVGNVVRHYDVTGKQCPAPFVKNQRAWEAFKEELEDKMSAENTDEEDDDMIRYHSIDEMPSYYREEAAQLVNSGALQGDTSGDLNVSDDMIRGAIIGMRYAEARNPRYYSLDDVPAWAREETQRLIDRGALQGDGKHELNVTYDALQAMIVCQRMVDGK